MSLNLFVGIGRITKDLELKQLNGGKSLCNFTIAINRVYEKDKADFINCVVWNKSAEYLVKYGSKGALVAVEGSLNIDKSNDTYYTKINVQNVSLVGGKSSDTNNTDETPQNTPSQKQEAQLKETQKFVAQEVASDDFELETTNIFDITEDDLPY